MSDSHTITIKQFFNALFPPDLMGPEDVAVISHPAGEGYAQQTASERHLDSADRRPEGWLFCVSSVVKPDRGQRVRRRLVDIREAYVLVLDDIGTKAVASPVTPSYILETSPGNFQHGFLLHPFDVSTPTGAAYYDSCLLAAADAGFSDPGMRSACRVAKVPGAIHKTGFVTRCTYWRPSMYWDLMDLMDLMGVTVKKLRARREAAVGAFTALDEVEGDPIFDWLKRGGAIHGANDFGVYITCPWVAGHTGGEQGSPSSTSYSPVGFGLQQGGFKCLHGHCQGKTWADFHDWAIAHISRGLVL